MDEAVYHLYKYFLTDAEISAFDFREVVNMYKRYNNSKFFCLHNYIQFQPILKSFVSDTERVLARCQKCGKLSRVKGAKYDNRIEEDQGSMGGGNRQYWPRDLR